jgi:hypothetical protein
MVSHSVFFFFLFISSPMLGCKSAPIAQLPRPTACAAFSGRTPTYFPMKRRSLVSSLSPSW